MTSNRNQLTTPTSIDTQKPIKSLHVLKYTGRILVTFLEGDFAEVYDPETFKCIEKIDDSGDFDAIHELPDKRISFGGTEDETTKLYKLAYDSRSNEQKVEHQDKESETDNESEFEFQIFDSNVTDILKLDEAPKAGLGGSYISGGLFLMDVQNFQEEKTIIAEIKSEHDVIVTAALNDDQVIVGRRDGRIEIYKEIGSEFQCVRLGMIPLNENCFINQMQITVLPSGSIFVSCKAHDNYDLVSTKVLLLIFDANLGNCKSINATQLPTLCPPFLLLHDGKTLLSYHFNLIFMLDAQAATLKICEIPYEISSMALTKNNFLLFARENTFEMVEADDFIADKKPAIVAIASQFLLPPLLHLIIDYGCLWKEHKPTPRVITENSLSPTNKC